MIELNESEYYMELDFIRDYAMYAVIFGIFGMSWFGWAQENPPKSWQIPLGIASGISFIVAGIGGYLAWQNWDGATALASSDVYKQFGIIVGIECALALIGSLVLYKLRKQAYVSAWIAFVVGIHFIPLAGIFKDNALYILAALVAAAPLVAVYLARRTKLSVVTLTGVFVGTSLFAFALRGLLLAL